MVRRQINVRMKRKFFQRNEKEKKTSDESWKDGKREREIEYVRERDRVCARERVRERDVHAIGGCLRTQGC